MEIETFISNNEDETIQLGFNFAERLIPGDSIALYGELGSGKTEMIKGICDFFEVEDIVSSPTFTIINEYSGVHEHNPLQIYHVDLYRIKTTNELDEIGFKECFYSEEILKLVEWAEKTDGSYKWDYEITLIPDSQNENLRVITMKSNK
jgi:tRNA threonylcarbamoyladenosine biosynthesis protein TsaE